MEEYMDKESIAYFKSLTWTFQSWKCSPALVDKTGFASHQYLGQKFDPDYLTIEPLGWTHDHCEICRKALCENNEEGDTSGFVSNNQWLCVTCYKSHITDASI